MNVDNSSSNHQLEQALETAHRYRKIPDSERPVYKMEAVALLDEIERLQPYEEQTKHLERRIRELTEQMNCLRLAHETPATLTVYTNCAKHQGMWSTMTVGYSPPPKVVCPVCDPPGAPEKASAPPPFAIGTRVRFIDSTSDHAEWVVYRLHDGWVHLHAADDRTYTHFAKPEQLRAVKVNAVPTQEWLDKSQGLTGLQYDEHGERMPEKATGDQS